MAPAQPLRRIVHQAREAGRLVADAAGVSAAVKSKTELGEELEIAGSRAPYGDPDALAKRMRAIFPAEAPGAARCSSGNLNFFAQFKQVFDVWCRHYRVLGVVQGLSVGTTPVTIR